MLSRTVPGPEEQGEEEGEPAVPSAVGGTHKSFMTQTTFESMASLIGQKSLMALQEAGLVYMTQVQESAIPIAVTGRDLIVKARTGTGKTLGFLIPSIERLHRNQYVASPDFGGLGLEVNIDRLLTMSDAFPWLAQAARGAGKGGRAGYLAYQGACHADNEGSPYASQQARLHCAVRDGWH